MAIDAKPLPEEEVKAVLLRVVNLAEQEGFRFPRRDEVHPEGFDSTITHLPWPETPRGRAAVTAAFLLTPAYDELERQRLAEGRENRNLRVAASVDSRPRREVLAKLRRAQSDLRAALRILEPHATNLETEVAPLPPDRRRSSEEALQAQELAGIARALHTLIASVAGSPGNADGLEHTRENASKSAPAVAGGELSSPVTDLAAIYLSDLEVLLERRFIRVETLAEWNAALNRSAEMLLAGGLSGPEVAEVLHGDRAHVDRIDQMRRRNRKKARRLAKLE